MNLNIVVQKKNSFDTLVVCTGITGSRTARELTEKGSTRVPERGSYVRDFQTLKTSKLETGN
jgi:choline dehydrogenase-like flavoprotein